MNKITPKKIMEIIFIFILPLLLVLANVSFYVTKVEVIEETQTLMDKYTYIEYEQPIIEQDTPIYNILDIPFQLLGYNEYTTIKNLLIDYTALWFTNFIIWHLLYLFFDTIMHKVLLRKE